MDIDLFGQTIAAVCIGNFVSAVFFWGALKTHKAERERGNQRDIPIKALLAMVLPCGFVVGMLMLTAT